MQLQTAEQIRILVADDHPLFREGIRAILDGEDQFILAGEAADGLQAVEKFRILRPDVTLMDLQMPVMTGIESIRLIRAEYPEAKLVALTTYSGDVQVVRALRAGAAGYLLKSALRTDLLNTIRAVHHGAKRSLSPEVASELTEHLLDEALTEREVEVLRRVAAGTSNKSIALEMGVTETTVKSHMKSLMAKLSANDRTHAVVIAMKRGILDG
jgi:DNA-binding NarL/FixJ family response regulator